MNRSAVISLVVGTMLAGNAGAYQHMDPEEATWGVERWQVSGSDPEPVQSGYRSEWQGAGIGALAGALLAGPPGFIVGAAGGVLAGRGAGLESDLHAARQEVERLEQQQQGEAQQRQRLIRQLVAEKDVQQRRLDAIAEGFVYRVHFRTGGSALEPAERQDLKQLAKALRTLEGLRIEIHAHADRRGEEAGNQRLSAARAEAVSRWLIEQGVGADRIVRHAHGESTARYPVADREGLGYDRQVVIRFAAGGAS